jgi:uncharacterized membrane protein HdeD (DUF308 family)
MTSEVRAGHLLESPRAPVTLVRAPKMRALVRNWWMMATRGALAVLFGLSVLVWPAVNLPIVVLLFAVYALLDGVCAIAAAMRASERPLDASPVAAEGVVSVTLGVLALTWPFVSRQFLYWVAGWGLLTGVLEVAAAVRVRRDVAGHWLLGTGGVSSLFLAVLILVLPHADVASVATLIGAYALVFGVSLFLAAVRFRGAGGVERT